MFVRYDSSNGKPTTFPVSASSVVAYLRAPSEDEPVVKRLISRAFAAFAKFTNGRQAVETTYEIFYDRAEIEGKSFIRLPVFPILNEGIELTKFDSSDRETSLDITGFRGDQYVHFGETIGGDLRDHNAVYIRVTVGYNDTNLPDDILAGIEQYISFLYESRGDVNETIPENVQLLWAPYVRHRLA